MTNHQLVAANKGNIVIAKPKQVMTKLGFQDLVSFLLTIKLQGSGFYPGEIILTECASFPLDTPSCRFTPAHCNRDVTPTIQITCRFATKPPSKICGNAGEGFSKQPNHKLLACYFCQCPTGVGAS